jgi:hypothetical protein
MRSTPGRGRVAQRRARQPLLEHGDCVGRGVAGGRATEVDAADVVESLAHLIHATQRGLVRGALASRRS